MGAGGSALGIVGDIMGGYGAYQEGQDNATVANYNADIATKNANIIQQQAQENERRSLVNSGKITASGEAAYGASGVSGVSAQMVLRNSAAQGALNALTIQHDADIKSGALRDEATLDRMRANNSVRAGDFGVASSVIGGIGDAVDLGMAVAG